MHPTEVRTILGDLIQETVCQLRPHPAFGTVVVEMEEDVKDQREETRYSKRPLGALAAHAHKGQCERSPHSELSGLHMLITARSAGQRTLSSSRHSPVVVPLPSHNALPPEHLLYPLMVDEAPTRDQVALTLPDDETAIWIGDIDSLPPCKWCHRQEWRKMGNGQLVCACYYDEMEAIEHFQVSRSSLQVA